MGMPGLAPIIEINTIAIKGNGDWVVLDVKIDFQCNGSALDVHVTAVEPPPANHGHSASHKSIRTGGGHAVRTKSQAHWETSPLWVDDEKCKLDERLIFSKARTRGMVAYSLKVVKTNGKQSR